MSLTKLRLTNFRNYKNKIFDFNKKITVFIGPNTSGKTNVLEAIYLLAEAKSFRSCKNEELIRWGEQTALVEGWGKDKYLKIGVQANVGKFCWVNKIKKSSKQYKNQAGLRAVIFRPEEIRLIRGSPTRRREFLDDILSSLDWRYYQALNTYNQAIRRRNKVLWRVANKRAKEAELFFWDKTLVKNGEIITKKRGNLVAFLNAFWQEFQNGKLSNLSCRYNSSVITHKKLEESLKKDLDKTVTTIGPHRDDFVVLSDEFKTQNQKASIGQSIALWGSRGQQRLASLALKFGHINFVESVSKVKPILLLDDIFSELDGKNGKLVLDMLPNYQTFITSLTAVDHRFGKQVIAL